MCPCAQDRTGNIAGAPQRLDVHQSLCHRTATESKEENWQLTELVQTDQRDFLVFCGFFFQCLIIIQRLLWAELSLPQIRMFKS